MLAKVSLDNGGFYGESAPYPKDISVEARGLKGMVKTVFPWHRDGDIGTRYGFVM